MRIKRLGIILLTVSPVVAILFKTPVVILLFIGLSLLLQLIGTLVYLIVLPEEWDASFGKALPILIEGEYIDASQVEPVKRVLKAAALTYFAAALADVLNIGRWLILLRR
jgi:hypothetical protein